MEGRIAINVANSPLDSLMGKPLTLRLVTANSSRSQHSLRCLNRRVGNHRRLCPTRQLRQDVYIASVPSVLALSPAPPSVSTLSGTLTPSLANHQVFDMVDLDLTVSLHV